MCDGKFALHLINICFVRKPFLKKQWVTTVCAIRGRNSSTKSGSAGGKKDTEGPFPPAYKPQQVEQGWYAWWEGRGFFTPENQSSKGKVFSMVLPPPNITGHLHLGHVLMCTIQDILARHRMRGDSVVWVPGLDHAGIATQVLVERKLCHEERLTRHDVGREGFTQRAEAWKLQQARAIVGQLRRLGMSLDWSREIYTMDTKQTAAVMEAFIHLFDAGVVYRDSSLVNWSCALQSAISDVEVVHRSFEKATYVEVPGHAEPVMFGTLTDFAYKLCDIDGEVVVSTTRLETMLGDVAVAVHPQDPRYRDLQGAHVWNPFTKNKLPIVFDECVDMKMGTGALKITPAHNTVDLEVARRHSLEIIPVIMEDGMLGENCGQFSGLKRFEARKRIHEELKQMNLLRGHKDHAMHVPFCSRSGDVVELLLKPQWFLRCKAMAEEAAAALQDGRLNIEPQQFQKVWYDWLYNIRDWCVSRQLWWGHRVPMYLCGKTDDVAGAVWIAASSADHARRKAAAQLHLSLEEAEQLSVVQDEDVLDTWFSSALLPFSALSWPDQVYYIFLFSDLARGHMGDSMDFKKYYPLSLMETGHDILFFWVARMVMLGLQLTCRVPFERILLHGILCDAHGRKMSKSLGNVVSPEDVIFGISSQELQKRNLEKLEAGLLSKPEFEKATEGQRKLFPNGIPECGADALRFTLASHNIKSMNFVIVNVFINFEVAECHTHSLFCNKLWQASRYTLLSLEKLKPPGLESCKDENLPLGKYDRWILSRLACMVHTLEQSLHSSDLHVATSAIKSFVHMEFCDVYVEATKLPVRSQEEGSRSAAMAACHTLLRCLDTTVHCLSPFMPFLAEELYQRLPIHKTAEQSRSLPYIHIKNEAKKVLLQEHVCLMAHLTRCEQVIPVKDLPQSVRTTSVANIIGPDCTVYLYHKGEVTMSEERANKKEKLSKELDRLLKMTASAGYREKASPQIQSTHLAKLQVDIKTYRNACDDHMGIHTTAAVFGIN
ncbi:hypothetical protein PR048_033707 [Dryococelus australis]|uniref:valine--tRNA ligase n=1 Tax=Dryococelus australis TaxID=614101 RepID=A0ABQ9G122_9NEOP|nr:hypothetical protein PR048_033707 [Dryococelus australis]